VHAGLEPKTVLLNLDSGGSTYAGLLTHVRRPLEIPVVVRRPVHLFGIAEHSRAPSYCKKTKHFSHEYGCFVS
jgi:hypothetical protein